MFDHVTIRASGREASERFYETVLRTLGNPKTHSGEHYAEWNDFSLSQASGEKPVTRRLHIGFVAPSRAHVDEFWRVGVKAGYQDDGAPGLRPIYREDYYGSFLLDPDGNSAEGYHHAGVPAEGIGHIWLRVADVDVSKRFYSVVAPFAEFRLKSEAPERGHFAGQAGSFTVVVGEPTENVHLALPVGGNAIVDQFHRAAIDAGYRDDGAPGERSVYHPGYYGAYVLDPDGNSVELVNHNR